jgi:hypothetical protein
MNRFLHSHIFQEVQHTVWEELGLTAFHTEYLGMAVLIVQYSEAVQVELQQTLSLIEIISNKINQLIKWVVQFVDHFLVIEVPLV